MHYKSCVMHYNSEKAILQCTRNYMDMHIQYIGVFSIIHMLQQRMGQGRSGSHSGVSQCVWMVTFNLVF